MTHSRTYSKEERLSIMMLLLTNDHQEYYENCVKDKCWEMLCYLKGGSAPWCHHRIPILSQLGALQAPPCLALRCDQGNCSWGAAAVYVLYVASSHSYPHPIHKRSTTHSYSKSQVLSYFINHGLSVLSSNIISWTKADDRVIPSSTKFYSPVRLCYYTFNSSLFWKAISSAQLMNGSTSPQQRPFLTKMITAEDNQKKFNKRPLHHNNPVQIQLRKRKKSWVCFKPRIYLKGNRNRIYILLSSFLIFEI